MNIGLTGGMGCGKSTALRLCAELGAHTFETDACVRTLLAEDTALAEEIRKLFGDTVFGAGGKVDRSSLASIVFKDSFKLSQLESLLHPRVRAAWLKEVAAQRPLLVVEIPLLFEKELQSFFDVTCCVFSHPEIQHRSLRGRGWSAEDIAARLARQWSLDRKAAAADVVALNDGSLGHLRAQLSRVLGVAAGC
ncbi:MAG: dephospho-CoA kinase [Opitutales bacterium]